MIDTGGRTRRLCTVLGLALAVVLLSGCETGFIQDAARSSLASFVTDVFATAVDATIGP